MHTNMRVRRFVLFFRARMKIGCSTQWMRACTHIYFHARACWCARSCTPYCLLSNNNEVGVGGGYQSIISMQLNILSFTFKHFNNINSRCLSLHIYNVHHISPKEVRTGTSLDWGSPVLLRFETLALIFTALHPGNFTYNNKNQLPAARGRRACDNLKKGLILSISKITFSSKISCVYFSFCKPCPHRPI